ncbi:MAG TPA: helix-turn-helix domain-containing protein, partial [Candidatus Saccharimonadales bacterium]|nr:helix-turn-helix domain-containing protein [Candidatus Saccharimonadales bacterium]
SAGAETRDRLMVELLAALADPTLTLAGFHACAAAALQTWHAVPDADVQELARDAMRIMHQAARHPRPSPPRHPSVRMAFEVLLREPRWLKEEKVADAAAVSPSHLGRLLVAEVGLDYRALRRGVVMKAAVIEILAGDEQVAQIAYRLGMHPGTFDQIFHETFGSSPRELRRYWRRPRS